MKYVFLFYLGQNDLDKQFYVCKFNRYNSVKFTYIKKFIQL